MPYNNIVILTGAGISAESGLKTFRDNNGLWEDHRVEDVATPEAFERHPEVVYRFYNQRRQQLLSDTVAPNAAHCALAKLEEQSSANFLLVTQNVDNLHERAGSQNVLHMHGELLRFRCCITEQSYKISGNIDGNSRCHCCQPPSPLRPDIVWFGEMPKYMAQIAVALRRADLFIAIGTSGNVYPAAGFVEEAKRAGAYTLELNLQPGAISTAFHETREGPAGVLVPAYIEELLDQYAG